MKKIIINTIIISLLSITTIFADNTSKNTTNNNNTVSVASVNNSNTAVVTITDLNGKTVYTATFTVNADNDSNIKVAPSSKLAKGTYVVTIILGGQKMTQKLVVE
jgi:hypothetical protein